MSSWDAPPAAIRLSADQVHAWRLRLDLPRSVLARLRRTLAPNEIQRADRFHFARDRDRFLAARGQLRQLLGHYLAAPPRQVRFRYGEHGKPFLADNETSLEFNLAHSGDLALVALTPGREIGVDIELHRPEAAGEQIARRFFSPSEVRALASLPESRRVAAFFRCWTRKEAFLKATGKGITFGLDQFSVSLDPNEASLLEIGADPAAARRWSLRHLDPGPGYTGALAVHGPISHLFCWLFEPA